MSGPESSSLKFCARIRGVITIDKQSIGVDRPPFIIAEMSGNHNQSLERALEIVEAAASTISSARSSDWLWLPDISAMMKGGRSTPMLCLSIVITPRILAQNFSELDSGPLIIHSEKKSF